MSIEPPEKRSRQGGAKRREENEREHSKEKREAGAEGDQRAGVPEYERVLCRIQGRGAGDGAEDDPGGQHRHDGRRHERARDRARRRAEEGQLPVHRPGRVCGPARGIAAGVRCRLLPGERKRDDRGRRHGQHRRVVEPRIGAGVRAEESAADRGDEQDLR